MQYIATFLYGILIDVLYVVWIHAVSVNRKHIASFATVGIALCGSLGTLGIVDNRWMLLPYLLGIYCGTVAGMRIKGMISSKEVHEEL